jgi:hypothetical protein
MSIEKEKPLLQLYIQGGELFTFHELKAKAKNEN